MEEKKFIKSNWLTKNPKSDGLIPTLCLTFLLIFTTSLFLNHSFLAHMWMPASFENVFIKNEWWRLWSTLFAHSDLVHICSNLFLFFPFSYFLIGYYGLIYFPLVGIFVGGLVNYSVLMIMTKIQLIPEHTSLIGFSGVVNWMGAAWLTLGWLIDRRESKGRRLLKVIAVTIVLFIPDSFKENVSYLSHFIGFIYGIISSLIFYFIFRHKIIKEEIWGVKEVDQYIPWYDEMLNKENEEDNQLNKKNSIESDVTNQ